MKKLLALIAAIAFTYNTYAQEATTYGDATLVNKEKASDLAAIQPALDAFKKGEPVEINDVNIQGSVQAVCKVKGCWMTTTLTDGTEIMIKFKDYGFFMPLDCEGKKFMCHGKIFTKVTSVAELKHLAEDAGKSKKQIAKIKKPKKELRFEADGVIMM
jgi:hypothetical protein